MIADILGYEFEGDDGTTFTVTGTPSWAGGNYVTVEALTPEGTTYETIRATALVRRHKQLSAA